MTFIHPTAVIGPNVVIEDDVYIGPHCIIGFPPEWKGREKENKGVVIRKGSVLTGLVTVDAGADWATIIGAGCYLMKHSHIGHDSFISADCIISCGAKIGGNVRLGYKCNVGLNAVIHQNQTIAEGCMIGASAFVSKTLHTKSYRKYAGVPAKDIGENIPK